MPIVAMQAEIVGDIQAELAIISSLGQHLGPEKGQKRGRTTGPLLLLDDPV